MGRLDTVAAGQLDADAMRDALRYRAEDYQPWQREYLADSARTEVITHSMTDVLRSFRHGADSYLIPLPNGIRLELRNDNRHLLDRLRGYHIPEHNLPTEVDVGNMSSDNLVALRHKIKTELSKRGEI